MGNTCTTERLRSDVSGASSEAWEWEDYVNVNDWDCLNLTVDHHSTGGSLLTSDRAALLQTTAITPENIRTRPGPKVPEIPDNGVPKQGSFWRSRSSGFNFLAPTSTSEDHVLPSFPKSEEVIKSIRAATSSNLLFVVLDEEERELVIESMHKQTFPGGVNIILQGDSQNAHQFYTLESGYCEVYKQRHSYAQDGLVSPDNLGEKLPVVYGPGSGFGELALLYNAPRQATVRAVTDVEVWVMERKHYMHVKRRYNERIRKEKLQLLDVVPLFKVLSEAQLDLIKDALEPIAFREGQQILRKGDIGDKFYIVKRGEVVVKIHGEEKSRLGAGNYFGEKALIKDEIREADVFASSLVQCMFLTRVAFQSILGPMENLWRVKAMRKIPMLCQLSEQRLANLSQELTVMHFEQGAVIYEQSDSGDSMFIVEEGLVLEMDEFNGSKNSEKRYLRGDYFGERTIVDTPIRDRTAMCLTKVTVACLDHACFIHCLGSLEEVLVAWRSEALRNVSVMKELTPDQRLMLARQMQVEKYSYRDLIVTAGESGSEFYIINSGEVAVIGKDGVTEVAELRVGDHFGEHSLITNQPREASIMAKGDVQVLVVGRELFSKILGTIEGRISANSEGKIEDNTQMKVSLENLTQISVLGVGAFGTVVLVQFQLAVYALKIMSKSLILSRNMLQQVKREKEIMRTLKCPFLVNMLASFQDEENVYILMEKVLGGEFFMFLTQRKEPLPEADARFYTACVVQAIEYMHLKGVMYRDLKPENLLIDATGYLKLTDYGVSKILRTGDKSFTMCGTPDYVAPEIINQTGHSHSVDWWALGVLVFEMVTSSTPFGSDDPMELMKNITNGRIKWARSRGVSSQCKDFIMRLLEKNPSQRLGAMAAGPLDIRKHPWFSENNFDWKGLQALTLEAPFKPLLSGPKDTSNFAYIPMEQAELLGEDSKEAKANARKVPTGADDPFLDW